MSDIATTPRKKVVVLLRKLPSHLSVPVCLSMPEISSSPPESSSSPYSTSSPPSSPSAVPICPSPHTRSISVSPPVPRKQRNAVELVPKFYNNEVGENKENIEIKKECENPGENKEIIEIKKECQNPGKCCNGCVQLMTEIYKLKVTNVKQKERLNKVEELLQLKGKQLKLSEQQVRLTREELKVKISKSYEKIVVNVSDD